MNIFLFIKIVLFSLHHSLSSILFVIIENTVQFKVKVIFYVNKACYSLFAPFSINAFAECLLKSFPLKNRKVNKYFLYFVFANTTSEELLSVLSPFFKIVYYNCFRIEHWKVTNYSTKHSLKIFTIFFICQRLCSISTTQLFSTGIKWHLLLERKTAKLHQKIGIDSVCTFKKCQMTQSDCLAIQTALNARKGFFSSITESYFKIGHCPIVTVSHL